MSVAGLFGAGRAVLKKKRHGGHGSFPRFEIGPGRVIEDEIYGKVSDRGKTLIYIYEY